MEKSNLEKLTDVINGCHNPRLVMNAFEMLALFKTLSQKDREQLLVYARSLNSKETVNALELLALFREMSPENQAGMLAFAQELAQGATETKDATEERQ